MKCSPIWLVNRVTPVCLIVTWLRGSRLWTIWSDFPSFLTMQNQCDWYEELEGSYVPASILTLMRWQTSSYIPGRIRMLR